MERLLEVKDLQVRFRTEDGLASAVDGVSFHLGRGETLGVVGEFGSGQILLEGEDLLAKSEAEMRRIRGNEVSMIFQEPMTSLNPVFSVGDQIAEAIQQHQGLSRQSALERAAEDLRLVGIPLPERRIHECPHQLSGGMRQRDAGKVVEEAPVEDLFRRPLHPYTVELLQSIPRLDAAGEAEGAGRKRRERLHVVNGVVPNPLQMPAGCRFHPRCPLATEVCRRQEPSLAESEGGHRVACWRSHELPLVGVAS